MKTSAVLTSALFGAMAVAAPFDKRSLVLKTEVVYETVVVYTTVYDDEPVGQATTTPAGYFYEQPKPSSAVASSSSPVAPVNTHAPAPSSSAPAAPIVTPTPSPSPSPSPPPQPAAPAPVSSAAPVEPQQPAYTPPTPPAPATSAAPAPAPASSPAPAPAAPAASPAVAPASSANTASSGAGEHTGDITIYNPGGATGACGTNIADTDFVVALAVTAFGASTYDVMTGNPTNKWCGQKIKASYNGNTVEATIMDMCPGCTGFDIDLTPAAWRQLTGSDEITRHHGATWSPV